MMITSTTKHLHLIFLATAFTILALGCENQPKVIAPVVESNSAESPSSNSGNSETEMHRVEVISFLQADKYTYMEVEEDDATFWVAVSKMSVSVGDKFFYAGGLLKRDFYSREFDRNFETLYLVSRITPAPGNSSSTSGEKSKAEVERVEIDVPSDAVSLSALFANKQDYNGKTIKVKGQCIKINNQIMDRNWVHVEDGSELDGEKIDLTITTMEMVPLGAVVVFEGVINLNKDFGAGYRYDIIMEDASVVR